ncbi:MAG TPA: 4-alpha-glucanotransferase [Acidimicrobiales bacterium]|nr:4-alpha-glucanotransferase [Acidimicrobiales bacterium]
MIEKRYRDFRGEWQVVPPSTVERVVELLGPPPASVPVRVVRPGDVVGAGELELEDGGSVVVDGTLPPDVPLGYHSLDGVRIIVTPGRCHLPDDLRIWGWAVQLYALRSSESWGIGDLGDLRRLGEWARSAGAGMLLVNPLHASLPDKPQASPYFPSSRCFRDPIYLRVDGDEGRSLSSSLLIDREAVWRVKRPALERAFAAFEGSPEFDRFVAEAGELLHNYAAFCGDVEFNSWLQWRLDVQLAEAGAALPVMQDLAIGVDPAGADVALWPDVFCLDARVGAPPDEFNAKGQDWGLPPFNPHRLQEAGYEPFIQTVRAGFRHAGGMRVDHVMGLFRLWWVVGEGEGAYVTYPAEDLLGILALESVRAQAFVVGEDLGTVEPWMRETLAVWGVLSYRLLWFEEDRPASFPRQALAAVTTHDLPTVAGLWSGSDLEEVRSLGLEPNEESTEGIRKRLLSWIEADDSAPVDEVVQRTHALLAEAPSMIVTATLDDALCVEPRPNVPGTTDERPNWSIPLPKPLEEIERDPTVAAVARTLAGRVETT